LKEITNLGYSEICKRIKDNKPVAEVLLFLNDYEEVEKLLTGFVNEAESKHISFEIFEISEDEKFSEIKNIEKLKITSQMLRNIFESSKETAKQIQDEDDAKFSQLKI
jgi:hypothetical protein